MSGLVAVPIWPTPDPRFFQGHGPEAWSQATVSGRLESALFGATRNNGHRFHEGLDIAPAQARTRQGEATDPILAVLDGRVAYINAIAGNSSYGRYVVIEHSNADVAVLTLYAHLAHIAEGLRVGQRVQQGTPLGTMGRSAGGYTIPKQRAHLHFEIAVMKSDRFAPWVSSAGSTNSHGNYNGRNLTGFDPLPLYEAVRSQNFTSFRDHIWQLPTAFTLRVSTRNTPDFIQRYPALQTRTVSPDALVGWLVEFTWYGLPKRWTPLTASEAPTARTGDVALVGLNPEAFPPRCSRTFLMKGGEPSDLTTAFRNDLRLIFGFE